MPGITNGLMLHEPRLGISEHFEDAQKSKLSHPRLEKSLFGLYTKCSKGDFIKEFLQCLMISFGGPKNSHVDNVLHFAAKYCIYHSTYINNDSDEFIMCAYQFLFENHMRPKPIVRLRVCQFINRILEGMDRQAVLDDSLFEHLSKAMRLRLKDKMSSIRVQAVMALHRLQEPHLGNRCEITAAFLFHLVNDPSEEVRKTVIGCIAVTRDTVKTILSKLNDKAVIVRKAVVKVLSKMKCVRFNLTQRHIIIRHVLYDNSEEVAEVACKLLWANWLKQVNHNFINLLSHLDVLTSLDECKKLLAILFGKVAAAELVETTHAMQDPQKRIVPYDKLTPEVALLWSSVVQHIKKEDLDVSYRQRLLPELTPFTNYIRGYVSTWSGEKKKKEEHFILRLLMEIAGSYSFSDEMGSIAEQKIQQSFLHLDHLLLINREQLRRLCHELIANPDVDESLGPVIMATLCLIVPSLKDRLIQSVEIISNLLFPQGEVEESGGEEEEDEEEGEAGSRHHKEIKVNDETLVKCLTIAKEMLQWPELTSMDPVLLGIKNDLVVLSARSQNTTVACLTIDVVSLLAIRDVAIANEYYWYFCLQLDDEYVCLSALEGVFDILCVHGFENLKFNILQNSASDRGSLKTLHDLEGDRTLTCALSRLLVPKFVELLESEDPDIQAAATQGLAKLFLGGKLSSPLVLSKLILLWFNPKTEKVPMVRQALGALFMVYPTSTKDGCRTVVRAFAQTLKTLHHADDIEDTPDPENVANVLIGLIAPTNLPEHLKRSQCGRSWPLVLAELLVDDLIRTRGEMVYVVLKILAKLEFIGETDGEYVKPLFIKIKRFCKIIQKSLDKRGSRLLDQFKVKLDELMSGAKQLSESREETMDVSTCSNMTEVTARNVDQSVDSATTAFNVGDLSMMSGVEMLSPVREVDGCKVLVPGTPSTPSDSRSSASEASDPEQPLVPASPESDSIELVKTELEALTIPETPESGESQQSVPKVVLANPRVIPGTPESSMSDSPPLPVKRSRRLQEKRKK